MKKLVGAILPILVVLLCLNLSRCDTERTEEDYGVSGKNIKVVYADDSDVYLKMVCPECGHISSEYKTNLCAGEEHSTVHQCEACFEVYDVVIDRS